MDVKHFAELIRIPCRICVASKSESGKTVLISELIQELVKQKKIFLPYVFCNTIGLGTDWDFIPDHLKSKFSVEDRKSVV